MKNVLSSLNVLWTELTLDRVQKKLIWNDWLLLLCMNLSLAYSSDGSLLWWLLAEDLWIPGALSWVYRIEWWSQRGFFLTSPEDWDFKLSHVSPASQKLDVCVSNPDLLELALTLVLPLCYGCSWPAPPLNFDSMFFKWLMTCCTQEVEVAQHWGDDPVDIQVDGRRWNCLAWRWSNFWPRKACLAYLYFCQLPSFLCIAFCICSSLCLAKKNLSIWFRGLMYGNPPSVAWWFNIWWRNL